jgi:hypothetical protein
MMVVVASAETMEASGLMISELEEKPGMKKGI